MRENLQNPIIPGFYPDPTICRVGEDFYLACSSFELCPGIPIFHSRDLVHWEQICNAMTPENGFHMEKNCMVGGVMAPTLRYYDGTFYMINANFSDRGNYIVTAEDPAGPWSNPHWLTDVPGIDASIFFDDDGKCYIMGTGDVWDNGAGVKERGIWLAEYDIENFRMKGAPVTIFNSALRVGSSPEAPHLYHVGEYYYLVIAEGGTEHYHAVMVARSRELFGFYEGNPANPVMTHRHMGFACPILNVGHADLVELPDGSWYAVMLASRLIDGKCKNLGRETFICPVVWERDWPLFSPWTGKVEWEYEAPASLPQTVYGAPQTRFDFEEPVEGKGADLRWIFWGTPYEKFYEVKDSRLYLDCRRQRLDEELVPMNMGGEPDKTCFVSMLAQRQCTIDTTVSCRMEFVPEGQESAGLAVVQAMNHQFHLERVKGKDGSFVQMTAVTADYEIPPYFPGFTSTTNRQVLARIPWEGEDVVLQIEIHGEEFICRCGADEETLAEFCRVDGTLINPEKVGCMSGTIIGMYATGNGADSKNRAAFDWFEIR
ncbi:MAG: glycoside hydrolase family 43 protein [Clostridiales bacterium]|nr:glycoside hydrolase family 43 protein [Clostridiales bacterium]